MEWGSVTHVARGGRQRTDAAHRTYNRRHFTGGLLLLVSMTQKGREDLDNRSETPRQTQILRKANGTKYNVDIYTQSFKIGRMRGTMYAVAALAAESSCDRPTVYCLYVSLAKSPVEPFPPRSASPGGPSLAY